jgi:hypothetical protein
VEQTAAALGRQGALGTRGLGGDIGAMMKLGIFVGTTLGGHVGWLLGDRFGFGVAFMLSGVGRVVGVYVGCK